MSIEKRVRPVVNAFAKENPTAARIVFTGSDRTPEKQLHFICERPKQYPVIGKAFRAEFKADIPTEKALKPEQKKWCLCFITDLAGKAGAYAHVGGKAQDLWVKELKTEERKKLDVMLKKSGFKVIYEMVSGSKSDYHAKMENTNVFHVYVD